MNNTEKIIEIQEDISLELHGMMEEMKLNHGYFDKKTESYNKLTDEEKKAINLLDEEDMFKMLSYDETWVNLILILHYGKFMNARNSLIKLDGTLYYVKEVSHSIKAGQNMFKYTVLLEFFEPYIPFGRSMNMGDIYKQLFPHEYKGYYPKRVNDTTHRYMSKYNHSMNCPDGITEKLEEYTEQYMRIEKKLDEIPPEEDEWGERKILEFAKQQLLEKVSKLGKEREEDEHDVLGKEKQNYCPYSWEGDEQ